MNVISIIFLYKVAIFLPPCKCSTSKEPNPLVMWIFLRPFLVPSYSVQDIDTLPKLNMVFRTLQELGHEKLIQLIDSELL